MRVRSAQLLAAVGLLAMWCNAATPAAETQAARRATSALRLYVFNLGKLTVANPASFGFTKEELHTTDLAVAGYLVVHPKGTLIWDTGVVPDAEVGTSAPGAGRAGPRLRDQLAAIGFAATDITFLALSHYHSDHTANANAFRSSIWLVRDAERAAMFADPPPPITNPAHYSDLKNSTTRILDRPEYDVFGDGTVVVRAAVGHTPGHQVLVVNLPKTGRVVLAGDLYHYPEERRLNRVPTFEFNKEQTLLTRAEVEDYIRKTGAQLWIEHDFTADAKLKKSPAYYE